MNKNFIDENRAVLYVSGDDASTFLQGLITNDIYKANCDDWIYALLLTPQGKIIADLFIQKDESGYILDCPKSELESIMMKFSLYKLRSDVSFVCCDEKSILICDDGYEDPRHKELWKRSIVKSKKSNSIYQDEYHVIRMKLKIPDFSMDLWPEKFFPHELGMNNLHAIDYAKGCYVGQEVTARVEYRGVVRKVIHLVSLTNPNKGELIISTDERSVGIILGHVGEVALSIIKEGELNGLTSAGQDVIILE